MNSIMQRAPFEAGQMWEKYVRAERFLPWNAARLTSDFTIKPYWIDSGDRFWYRYKNRTGTEFILVNPKPEARSPAFDHHRLAAALSVAAGRAYSPYQLPFNEVEFCEDGKSI